VDDGSDCEDNPCTQADVLQTHLKSQIKLNRSNFVIAFVHGWRHDARVGDTNVADLRIYAASIAAFLARRCAIENRYCNTTVTAVYVGWRGARVDETWLRRKLGSPPESFIGKLAAIPETVAAAFTLFDRKPVSEQIAPSVISLLDLVSNTIMLNDGPKENDSRLIIFGHNLGGNTLAVGIKERLIKSIRELTPQTKLKPPIGDLAILLNPASEAANWTVLQRTVQERVSALRAQGHETELFQVDQPPVLISLTSARTWPAGGVRVEDCKLLISDWGKPRFPTLSKYIREHRGEYTSHIKYDWATHDLFPTFRGDFRPGADTLDWLAFDLEGRGEMGHDCLDYSQGKGSALGLFLHGLANIVRVLPFQNTEVEYTRTIGHLDPRRPVSGFLVGSIYESPRPFGTTHEMEIEWPGNEKQPDLGKRPIYRKISELAYSECASIQGWLTSVRTEHKGRGWDSAGGIKRTPIDSKLDSQFRHGLLHSGMRAITHPNDPLWNVRALDTALSHHGGYVTKPLVCSLSQFVMDDITLSSHAVSAK